MVRIITDVGAQYIVSFTNWPGHFDQKMAGLPRLIPDGKIKN